MMWDFVENGYVRPTTAKSKWDKAAFALANANSKAINAIFYSVSTDEFHRISHVKTAKEAWTILETTYEGTKKVKDTKLQMLITRFEEVKMSNDELFDSFYGKLKEIVIAKLNLWEKVEDDKREFKKKDGKDSPSTQGIVCYECNGRGHLNKECSNYLKGKSKVFATTLSDSESSNSDAEGECDNEGNYSTFMAITVVDSRDDLSDLFDKLGVHSEGEEVDDLEDKDVCLNKGKKNLQEVYYVLLEDCGRYAKVAKNAFKKTKKIEEEHKSTLVQLKDTKCEVEGLKEELLNAYSKIKFLELEIIQANVKVECISTKKLDSVLSSKKFSTDKIGLGYTGEGSSSNEPKKEVRFVSAKNLEKYKV